MVLNNSIEDREYQKFVLSGSDTAVRTTISAFSSLTNPTRTDVEGGGKVSVGTSAVAVTFIGVTNKILIRADKDNTGLLYIGKSNVTNTGANAITYLEAGDIYTDDYDDVTNTIYVVASIAGQFFWKGADL